MGFFKYVIRRLLTSIVTIFGIIIIIFILSRALPGDPVWFRLPEKATMEDYYAERARLGLDQPVIYQLFVFMSDLLTGNWGFSYVIAQDSDVWSLIVLYLPRTFEVMFISMFLAIGLGIMFGKITAKRMNSFWDYLIRISMYLILSVPAFVIIIFFVLLYINSPYKIFPLYGYKTVYYPDPTFITGFPLIDSLLAHEWYIFLDLVWHLIIPVATMTIVQMVAIIRQTRTSLLDAFQMDFIRTAKAKGCSNRRIVNKHAMKLAIPPVITISAMGFPIVMGGMVGVEVAYHFVGIGFTFREAVIYRDYSVLIAVIFLFSLLVVIFNFLSDVIIGFLDPRIRFK
ncbi:MAG: ABC transporter permease [Candidatus Lokiarchaeota archaeon]|nr:ABC transporter permease [Candidatus Lokiarchaeota archaeon]